MRFLATTIPGLEEIAVKEISEITGESIRVDHRGLAKFQSSEDAIFLLNYRAKSLHRIILLLLEANFSTLRDIYRKGLEIDFFGLFRRGQKFAVRAERRGEHAFTSMEVERVLGQAVLDSFAKGQAKPVVNLENPEIIVRAEVRNQSLWIGLDTTGEDSLHKRGYRPYEHAAPLKPTIAYCLVRLSGWKEDESFVDPMCGSGTICIEAALWGNRVPNWFRNDYAFWNFSFLDKEKFLAMKQRVDAVVEARKLRIQGCDISRKHVSGGLRNAGHAGVEVEFFQGDATRIPLNYDRIVINPPYGLRVGSRTKVKRLYEDFVSNLYRYGWKRTVILTGSPDLFPEVELMRRLDIRYGNLQASVLIMQKN